jgi:hypothetical protein
MWTEWSRVSGKLQQGEKLGLTEDEVRFYDVLIENESAVR